MSWALPLWFVLGRACHLRLRRRLCFSASPLTSGPSICTDQTRLHKRQQLGPRELRTTMSTKRQTRLQLRRQPKSDSTPAAAPPISALLSQYELLTSLCEHLSSADVVHLGATSKEHWEYIGASPKPLKSLIGNSSCDGTGIIAQARVFGQWKADPEKATRKCRGRDAQPCHDCGAMVCNVRASLTFHISSVATDH